MPPDFLLLGDSHAGALKRAAEALNVSFTGGNLMAGKEMNDYFFRIDGNQFVLTSESASRLLAGYLRKGKLGQNLLDIEVPLLSTVGFNTHNFESAFRNQGLTIDAAENKRFISAACFEAVVDGARRGALEFYRALRQADRIVYAVLSPQRFAPEKAAVCRAFEVVMVRRLLALGVGIIDVRAETTDGEGVLLSKFEPEKTEDWVHANGDFGAIVIKKFRETLAAR
jgi:hypothetical protein